MSIDAVKTVKVHAWGKGQGEFVEINESDFDVQKHKLYKDGVVVPPAPVAVNVPPPAPVPVADGNDEPKATAKAVELAIEAGIDLATVVGSGKNGKITVEDVETAIEALTAPIAANGG